MELNVKQSNHNVTHQKIDQMRIENRRGKIKRPDMTFSIAPIRKNVASKMVNTRINHRAMRKRNHNRLANKKLISSIWENKKIKAMNEGID